MCLKGGDAESGHIFEDRCSFSPGHTPSACTQLYSLLFLLLLHDRESGGLETEFWSTIATKLKQGRGYHVAIWQPRDW